ncbi:hypothetical protein DRQ25_14400 [Candidatus Fermentibacteria bacterium]|nr:MAG: hypothetical protein DRQ25_14400 [Candidatus Fermentibacteria bacterium]
MERLTIKNKQDERLVGVLHGTISGGKLAIVCHGLADTKENPILIAICEALAANDIPSFRFDFSGNGDSEGEFSEATYHKERDDLQAVLDWFGNTRVREFLLIGHSMGGGVIRAVGAQDSRVKALISLAGVARAELFKQKFPEEYAAARAGETIFFGEERFGKRFPLDARYLDSAESIDIMATAPKIKAPCLCIIGDQDMLMRREHEQERLDALPVGAPKKLVIIPGADHVFNRDEGEDMIEKLLEELIPWVQKHY